MLAFVADDEVTTIDCSGVETVDVTFVQLVLAAARTARARSVPVRWVGLAAPVRALFDKAGVDPGQAFLARSPA